MSDDVLPALHLRGKVFLSGLTLLPGQSGVKADFSFVSRGDRNAQWASATPMGSLSMTVNNPSAAARLEEFMQAARRTGKQPELFLDLTPSEDGWPGDGHKFREAVDIPKGVYGHGHCGECGMAADAKLWGSDPETGRSIQSEELAHPNG